jgi:hypothetical protein
MVFDEPDRQRFSSFPIDHTGGGKLASAGILGEYPQVQLLRLLQCGQRREKFLAALGRIDLDVFLHHHIRTAVINSFNAGEPSYEGGDSFGAGL